MTVFLSVRRMADTWRWQLALSLTLMNAESFWPVKGSYCTESGLSTEDTLLIAAVI